MTLSRRQKTIETIILNVNEELNIDLRDKSRVRMYVFARAVVYEILRKHLRMSLSEISKVFNNNHATVLHSLNQLPYTIKYDPELQHSYNNIINKWLKNVENFIPLSEIDLKNQIKVLINENKDLNLEVTELKKSLSLYTGKYKKYYELVDNISHRVGNNFSDFERKINTLLNGYNIEDIDKILNFKSWSNKKKIDTLLFIDCTLYANMGKESTQTERQSTKSKSKRLYKAIGKIDESIGKQILNSLD